ncbi:MAG: flavodoxin-dependent (E)-4-hydroxy-3-methylbut-2-enyl-diphosphate synthase, partial [Chitinispirillia bacterium]
MINRKTTRQIKVRNIPIGGNSPITIQSMTNTPTHEVDATLNQINELINAGCELVRISIPDQNSVEAFKNIRKQTEVPLIADIHFQYRLAIAAIEEGADKIRINPGNIGSRERVKTIVDAAKYANIPIRIGINSGSLEKDLLAKYGSPTPEALVDSALRYISMMEQFSFYNFIISIKATNVLNTVQACRFLSEKCDYPQHIGITESGTIRSGTIRSSVGLGILLAEGIGDTIRVSLSGDPVKEIFVAKEILKSLGIKVGPTVIACPTCSRTQIDVAYMAEKVESMISGIEIPIKIAVMGCIVNGPGEAREADIGIAGGNKEGILFM